MAALPIRTERLVLREFRPEDEAAIHAYASDPDVTRHTSWGPNDIATTKAALNAWIDSQTKWPREALPLAIELQPDGKVIGGTGFSSIDLDTLTGVFGYVLHKEHWGKGYATEAVCALLEFGFGQLALHRIVAECFTGHDGSIHILEKVGMRREGFYQKNALKAGEWRDTYTYAMLQDEWWRRPKNGDAPALGAP